MRRLLVLLVTGVLVVLSLAATAPPASAAGHVRGRIVEDRTGAPAQSQTVRLRRAAAGGGPGAVVATAVTDVLGRFDLDAGTDADDEYFVELVAQRFQGGYLGTDHVQADPGQAVTFGGGSGTGTVRAVPAYIVAKVVDARTHRPVRGVRVTAGSANRRGVVQRRGTTDAHGNLRIFQLDCEDDCYLRLDGRGVGHEVGYRACDAGVVPTWPAACATPLGRIGRIRLQRS